MKLKFKKQSEQTGSLKTIGTVAAFVGQGGYHELSSTKNFKDTSKRVSIRLVNKDNEMVYVNCSRPLSDELRASKDATELKAKLANVALLPILELPQLDEQGNPVMVLNEETGTMEELVLYSISFTGASDMSSTRTTITSEMLSKEVEKRAIRFEDLIAI